MSHTFIYGLLDPNTGNLRYVGKSNNPIARLAAHCYEARHSTSRNHKNNWVKHLLDLGSMPVITILEKCLMEVWQDREIYHMEMWKGLYLLNVKPGGQGQSTLVCSVERAAKISKALNGRKIPISVVEKIKAKNTGKVRTDESKQRYRESKQGVKNPNYGKPITNENRQALNNAVVGIPKSESHKSKIGKALSIPVSQYDETGIFIAYFTSAKDASAQLSIPRTSITACLSGRIKKAGGFIWKYTNGIK